MTHLLIEPQPLILLCSTLASMAIVLPLIVNWDSNWATHSSYLIRNRVALLHSKGQSQQDLWFQVRGLCSISVLILLHCLILYQPLLSDVCSKLVASHASLLWHLSNGVVSTRHDPSKNELVVVGCHPSPGSSTLDWGFALPFSD